MLGVLGGDQRRRLLQATILDERATGGEAAPFGRVDEIRRAAGDHVQARMAGVFDARDALQQESSRLSEALGFGSVVKPASR